MSWEGEECRTEHVCVSEGLKRGVVRSQKIKLKKVEDFKHFWVNRTIESVKKGIKQVGMGGEKSQVKKGSTEGKIDKMVIRPMMLFSLEMLMCSLGLTDG